MIKDPVIYCIKNKFNNKMYFGQTVNFNRRMNEYMNRSYSGSSKYYIMKILDVFGRENFDFSIVEHCAESELAERESYYINKYNTINPLFGYNSQRGENDKRVYKRTRQLMSASHTGLTESGDTKRKKSHTVCAINNNIIIISDSGKLLGDYLHKSKDIVSHAITQPHKLLGYYVYYKDIHLQDKIVDRRNCSNEYLSFRNIINSFVETIERHYNVIYLRYSDK